MLLLGLMSGTSADGISTALVRVEGGGARSAPRVRLLHHRTYPYRKALRARLLGLPAATAPELCRMNFVLGEEFARAALRAIREAGVSPRALDLVASHGQTVWHVPAGTGGSGSTLQIGAPAVIAERTGVPVAADFRPRDIAAGGQGAPLVPFFDGLVFRPRRRGRTVCVQNIGGIANVTVVGRDGVEAAFDTGPGNCLLDAAARRVTRGRQAYDRGGRQAAAGHPREDLVRALLRHPYFRRPPPKSTGRETFGDRLLEETVPRVRLSGPDRLATLTRFVACAIHDAYVRHVFPRWQVEEVLLSGGGARNPVLRRALADRFAPLPVHDTDTQGVPADAREAMAFALLGWALVVGRAANVPAATGAARRVVLGSLHPGSGGRMPR